jgi:outer membrane immunogenic protein
VRKFLLFSLVLASFAGQAVAADLPSAKSAPVLLEAPFSWNGFYIGADVGGLWGQGTATFPTTGVSAKPKSNGVFGGGYIGYNFQVKSVVFSLQAEANGAGSGSGDVIGSDGNAYKLKQSIFGSGDARIGYAMDRTLLYVIGGVAFADTRHDMVVGANDYNFNFNHFGYDLGAGLEYAFTNNWTARIEYRYYDFGKSSNYPFTCSGVTRCNIPEHDFTTTDHTVRLGLTYKFGPAPVAPVVAKY